jgi:hypothetical protein
MSDFIPWIAAVAIGCALGGVFIVAKQAICEIIPQSEPAIKPASVSDQWRIVSEGVLALDGTGYEIRLENVAAIAAFRIYHNGRSIEWELRLEKAKQSALRHMREMIEMGVEP